MKKALVLLLAAVLALGLFAGCGKKSGELVVGATSTPHAEILKVAKDLLAKDGYTLKIMEFSDYVQLNPTLANKELDANYFQHEPYLIEFNAKNSTELLSIGAVHYEPYGIYPGKTKSLADLKDGAQIAVPNDTTNEARALLLLEAQGLIKLNPDAGLNATIKDITENPKNLKIIEIEAAQLPRSLPDVDFAVINGNYAIQAGFNVAIDAVATEDKASLAATTFANIVAVRKGDENREDLKALVKALQSEEVKAFINEKYAGAVVPTF